MLTIGLRLGAGAEEGVPVVVGVVHARQAEEGRDLAEAHGAHATVRVAPHLGRRQLGVPQRDEAERDEPAARVAAPLLDHPVVVGLHAEQAELVVLGLGEGLAAEAGEGREAQRRLDVVGVHVVEAGLHLVGARAHVLVGDALHGDLVARHADGGVDPQQRALQVLVVPPVDGHAFGARLHLERAAPVLHLGHGGAHDPRPDLGVLGGEAVLPHVGRLDHVVVDRDDHRQGLRHGHSSVVPHLTGRQMRRCGAGDRLAQKTSAKRSTMACQDRRSVGSW